MVKILVTDGAAQPLCRWISIYLCLRVVLNLIGDFFPRIFSIYLRILRICIKIPREAFCHKFRIVTDPEKSQTVSVHVLFVKKPQQNRKNQDKKFFDLNGPNLEDNILFIRNAHTYVLSCGDSSSFMVDRVVVDFRFETIFCVRNGALPPPLHCI